MDFLTVLTIIAFLLVAVGMGGRSESPWPMLVGFLLVATSIVARLVAGGGFFAVTVPLFTDMGLSLVLASAWLVLRRPGEGAGPFFALGIGALGVAGLLYVLARLMGVYAEASILVELGPDDHIEEIFPILNRYDATFEQAFPSVGLALDENLAQVFMLAVSTSDAPRLMEDLGADRENIDHVELNGEVSTTPILGRAPDAAAPRLYLENDPRVAEQWALEAIRGHEAHAILRERAPTRMARLAIVDTGIDARHEDLEAVLDAGGHTSDENGHGTHCAGIAAAATNNRHGVASLNWDGAYIQLAGYRALGEDGSGTLEEIAQAVIDAAQADADVVSMSLGSFADEPPRVLALAVGFALERGAIVVASAGNAGRDAAGHFPSNIEGVIAVAAVDQNLRKASFSNSVGALTRPIAAPGVDVLSSYPGNDYSFLSGTSMAAPIVAGIIGVMRALDPALTAEEAYGILHETGTTAFDMPQTGRVVNAEAAIGGVLARLPR